MVFSGGTDRYLIMANDSRVVRTLGDGTTEMTTGKKSILIGGVGVVTMWGSRDHNDIVRHLDGLSLTSEKHTVEDLGREVHRYLTDKYAPHTDDFGDTGYHVGGFMPDGTARLYHIYWNTPGSGNAQKNAGAYTFELHHLAPGQIGFMYNGRPDVATNLMQGLITEFHEGRATTFPWTPSGVCRLAHFVLRASSEITMEVAPHFMLYVLGPNRRCVRVPLDETKPSTDADFSSALQQAGIS
jgi:hypothetical protein